MGFHFWNKSLDEAKEKPINHLTTTTMCWLQEEICAILKETFSFCIKNLLIIIFFDPNLLSFWKKVHHRKSKAQKKKIL